MEAITDHRPGKIINHYFAEYHVPAHADISDIEVIFVDEHDDKASPLGVKGLGEIGIVGAAAAVANAIFNATGKRVRDFPITLDKIISGLSLTGGDYGTGSVSNIWWANVYETKEAAFEAAAAAASLALRQGYAVPVTAPSSDTATGRDDGPQGSGLSDHRSEPAKSPCAPTMRQRHRFRSRARLAFTAPCGTGSMVSLRLLTDILLRSPSLRGTAQKAL